MNAQFALSRRDAIESRLLGGLSVSAAELALEFKVSEDSVRRDLRALAAEGKCRRVYGGAIPLFSPSQPMVDRIGRSPQAKSRLARTAAAMVEPGEFLFLDCGSTNLAIVAHLPKASSLTVATNSVDIAAEVLRRGGIPVLVVGGSVNPLVGGSVDATAVRTLEELNIDRCFIGACAVSATNGVSVHEPDDGIFKRALLRQSAVNIVMATSGKLHERAPHRVGGPSEIDFIVVDDDLPLDDDQALAKAGFTLVKPPRQ